MKHKQLIILFLTILPCWHTVLLPTVELPSVRVISQSAIVGHAAAPLIISITGFFGLGEGITLSASAALGFVGLVVAGLRRMFGSKTEQPIVMLQASDNDGQPSAQKNTNTPPPLAAPPEDEDKERKNNTVNKSEFFKGLKGAYRHHKGEYYKRVDRAVGLEKAEYLKWDYTHNDVEAFSERGGHLGSIDPFSKRLYKPPVWAREMPKGAL